MHKSWATIDYDKGKGSDCKSLARSSFISVFFHGTFEQTKVQDPRLPRLHAPPLPAINTNDSTLAAADVGLFTADCTAPLGQANAERNASKQVGKKPHKKRTDQARI